MERPTSMQILNAGAVVFLAVVLVLWFWSRSPDAPPPTDPPDAGLSAAVDAGAPPPPAPRAAGDTRPNIVLLTIDSVRADHVGAYGYDRETAPTLTALAARGTLFRSAYTTSSWSVPAIASILTGVSPAQHGVLHGPAGPRRILQQEALPEGLPSLASALHDAGYLTIGLSATQHFDPALGYGRGFDEYRVLASADSSDVTATLGGRLDALRASPGPWFVWVHLIDPHLPYTPREPQFTAWWPDTRPRLHDLERVGMALGLAAATRRANVPAPVAREYLTAAYDSEIRAADDFLDDLLSRLDDGHLAVIVTSTHGEELGDHHGMGHGRTLFEELVHVPLVVAMPGAEPSEVTSLVSLIDVLPTILQIADAPEIADLPGRSLVPAMRGDAAFPASRDVLFETGGLLVLRGIFDGHYKYADIIGPHAREALFDLTEDPYEQTDVLAAHPDVAAAMRQRMLDAMTSAEARHPSGPAPEIPEPIFRQLMELGYGAQ